MEASVVIACRNGARHLEETLDAVAAQEWDRPWEVVFVDNGSTDGSRALFDRFAVGRSAPVMRSLDASGRLGKAYALNAGVRAAAAPAIVVCDADDVPAPGWLAAMAEALRRHPFVAAGCEVERLNRAPTGLYRDVARSGVYRLRYPPYAETVPGCAMGFTRAMWEKIGGFGEAFAIEDDEFCARAALHGFRPHPVPGAIVHYRLRSDLRAVYRQAYTYSLTDVAVAKAFRGTAPAQSRPWLGLAREARKAATRLVEAASAPAEAKDAAMAKACWKAGSVMGQIAGVLRHRVPPTTGTPAVGPEAREPARKAPLHAG